MLSPLKTHSHASNSFRNVSFRCFTPFSILIWIHCFLLKSYFRLNVTMWATTIPLFQPRPCINFCMCDFKTCAIASIWLSRPEEFHLRPLTDSARKPLLYGSCYLIFHFIQYIFHFIQILFFLIIQTFLPQIPQLFCILLLKLLITLLTHFTHLTN